MSVDELRVIGRSSTVMAGEVVEACGKKAQTFTFDPDFEKVVLSPLMIGG